MMQSSPCQSDPASALCLVCQALYRWHEHFEEHGTPPEPQDFVALWPGTDLKRLRKLLMVLAYAGKSKESEYLGAMCDCTAAMRREYERRMQGENEQVKIAAAEGNGKAVVEATQKEPVVSVRFPRPWKHLAAACIGLVVVIGGVIGWDEFFNIEITDNALLADTGQFAEILDEWEMRAFQLLEDSTVTQDGQDVVSFDLLDENRSGMLSLAGIEDASDVDATLAHQLMQTYFDTVYGLLGKTEEEVNAGMDALLL